jgi:hypothetical protein
MTRSRPDGSMLGLAAAATLAFAAAALGRPRGGSRSTALTSAPPVTLDTMKSKRFRFAEYRRDPFGALAVLDELRRRVTEAESQTPGYAYGVPFEFPRDLHMQAPYWYQQYFPDDIRHFLDHRLDRELKKIQGKMQDKFDPIYQEWFTEGASISPNPKVRDGQFMIFNHDQANEHRGLTRSLNRHGPFAITTPLGVKRIGPTDEQLRSLEAYINRLILGFEQMERLAAYIQDWADNFSESLFDEELWIQYLIECNYTRDHIEDLIMNGE